MLLLFKLNYLIFYLLNVITIEIFLKTAVEAGS